MEGAAEGGKSNAKLQKQVAEGGWEERAQGASGRGRDGGELQLRSNAAVE